MCNTLKVQIICFKNNLDITFTWYDDFISDIIDYGALNECVSIVSMWKTYNLYMLLIPFSPIFYRILDIL